MFPFIIKGKVLLGSRKDYHLSEAGLRERIAERLIRPARKSEMRTDGSFSGDGRGLLAEGWSRLKSMGFLTMVRVRKIRIISRKDLLFAGYEMDATASTLVNVVVIPLVLGSILFSHSAFGFYETLAILILIVCASWGTDVLVLVMMLRHEIRQIASEIRAIMMRRDMREVDPHHVDISPEELLATAYYYERNGLVKRCEAYLSYLAVRYPDTFEASLAMEHMVSLEGIPVSIAAARTREGERKEPAVPPRKRAFRFMRRKFRQANPGRGNTGASGEPQRKRPAWFRLPGFLKRKKGNRGMSGHGPYRRSVYAGKDRKGGRFRWRPRETFQERMVRKRRERLERRESFAHAPNEQDLPFAARVKLRLRRLVRWEGRQERRYRKKQERWLHGPRTRSLEPRASGNNHNGISRRPNWLRSKKERQALEQQRRWTQGPHRPGGIQRSRDRWGRWLLQRDADRKARSDVQYRSQAEEG